MPQEPDHVAERLDIAPARRAVGEVRLEAGTLRRRQGAKRVRRRQLQPPVVGHASPPASRPAREPRSFSIPARMRVLTVPNGSCSSAAISVWVRPPKYASSITRRCGSGSSASERVTSRRASWRWTRSEEHTSELQSQSNIVCRLLLEKKKIETHTLYAA